MTPPVPQATAAMVTNVRPRVTGVAKEKLTGSSPQIARAPEAGARRPAAGRRRRAGVVGSRLRARRRGGAIRHGATVTDADRGPPTGRAGRIGFAGGRARPGDR